MVWEIMLSEGIAKYIKRSCDIMKLDDDAFLMM